MNPSLGRASQLAGVVLLGLVLASAGLSLRAGIEAWSSHQPAGPAEPLPEFAIERFEGGKLRHTDLRGQVTLVMFWATWCGACSTQMSTYAALHERFADTDLRILGVNRDGGSKAERRELIAGYTSAKGLRFEQALDDGRMGEAFGVQGIPHAVLVDRAGMIRFVHIGLTREKVLAREIEELLEQ